MKEKYIQAIILGSIIGLAIIVDDFIVPKSSRSIERHMMMVDGKGAKNNQLVEAKDHSVMIFKTDDGNIDKKIQIKIDASDIRDIDINKILNSLKSELSDEDLDAIQAKLESALQNLSESLHGLKEIEVEVEVL
jgi:transcriptional regulator of heat shock response